ncbi:MAG TPA: type II secretion system protein [Thermoanaerobaculia bacterium]|nr:type II secretion system protein [Thermoanaerobaculia bacterium]
MERGTMNTEHGTMNDPETMNPAERRSPVPCSVFRVLRSNKGFSLIELIVVVTIIGILASVAIVNVKHAVRKAREAALKDNLYEMRKAIDNFYADKQRYPTDLNELVPNYIRRIPADPISQQADWEQVVDAPDPDAPLDDQNADVDPSGQPLGPGVVDVKSKSPGKTLDNVPYSEL